MEGLGVYWYVGKTQSGKTTLALKHLKTAIARDGHPALILDCMPAKNFAHLRHEASIEETLKRLYGEGRHAIYTPRSEDEMGRLAAAIHAAGRVHVLWDESSFYMSRHKIDPEISGAVRGWFHTDVSWQLTTQRPGDIHGDVYACDPEVYAFRTEKDGDLDRLEAEFKFKREDLLTLEQGAYKTKRRGF